MPGQLLPEADSARSKERRRQAYAAQACALCVKRKRKCIVEKSGRACARCQELDVPCTLLTTNVVWKREATGKDSTSSSSAIVTISPRSYDSKLGTFSQTSALGFHLISLHKRKLKGAKPYPGVKTPWPLECLRWHSFESAFQTHSGRSDELSEFHQVVSAMCMINGAKASVHSQIIGPRPLPGNNSDPWNLFTRPCDAFAAVGTLRRSAVISFEQDILQRCWTLFGSLKAQDLKLSPRQVEMVQLALDYIESDTNADAARDARKVSLRYCFEALDTVLDDESERAWISNFMTNTLYNDAILSGCRGLPPLTSARDFLTLFTPSITPPVLPPVTATDFEAIFPPTHSWEDTVTLRLRITKALEQPLADAVFHLFFAQHKTKREALLRSWDAIVPALKYLDNIIQQVLENPYSLFLPPSDLVNVQLFCGCMLVVSINFYLILVARHRMILDEEKQAQEVVEESWKTVVQSFVRASRLVGVIFDLATGPFAAAQFQAMKGCGQFVRYAAVVEPERTIKELRKPAYASLRDGLRYTSFFSPMASAVTMAILKDPAGPKTSTSLDSTPELSESPPTLTSDTTTSDSPPDTPPSPSLSPPAQPILVPKSLEKDPAKLIVEEALKELRLLEASY